MNSFRSDLRLGHKSRTVVRRAGATGETRPAIAAPLFGRIKWKNVNAYILSIIPRIVCVAIMSRSALCAAGLAASLSPALLRLKSRHELPPYIP